MSIQKLAYTGDSKIIKNLVNRVNALIDAGGGGGGASSLSDLDDTSISSPTSGQVLEYDSQTSKWKNANPPSSGVDDVKVDGTSVVVDGVAKIITPDLDDLESVAISSPSNGQVLEYDNQTQKWKNVTPSSGSSLTAIETTSSAYSQLPSVDKQDATKIYFLNDTQSGTQDTPIDLSTLVYKKESSMSRNITNDKLVWKYNGGSLIGACDYYSVKIPKEALALKIKLTTGTCYGTDRKIAVGVKATYQDTSWVFWNDADWLAVVTYNTTNSSAELTLDLSSITVDSYLMMAEHGWTVTFDEITLEEPSAPTGETKIKYKDITYGADGSGSSWKDLIQTLSAGSTSITFSDAEILNTSTLDFYTDIFGVCPTDVVASNGSVTLTFDAQQTDMDVKVRITNTGSPSPYIFKEYLEVTSVGPYIDTGVANSSTAYFEVDFQYTGTPTDNDGIFGTMGSGIEFVINSYGGVSYANTGGSRAVFTSSNLDRHVIKADNTGILIDGVNSGATVNWGIATGYNYYIFGFNYNNGQTIYKTGHAKIYSVKLYDGTDLVRYFIPAVRKSDNVIGMYDSVTDTFYVNDGSGSFVTN